MPRNNVLFASQHTTFTGRGVYFLLHDSLIWAPATRFAKLSTSGQNIWRWTLGDQNVLRAKYVQNCAKHLSTVCYSAVRLVTKVQTFQINPPQKTRFQTETKRIFSVNLQETISVFQKRHSWAFSAARGGRTTRHLWVSKYSLTVLFLDTILSSFFAIRMRSSSRVIAAFTRVRTNL